MSVGIARRQRRRQSPAVTRRRALTWRFPRATYRLQFNHQFTFEDALTVTDYLHELGISDCYASPWLEAVPQSTHGYNVCAFEQLNPDLGSESDLEAWTRRLRQLGIGVVLDIVPNHMAATFSNRMFRDVLQNGVHSPFARWFDIQWEPSVRNPKVLLPVLEDYYGAVLESGKLQIVRQGETFVLRHGENQFPLSPPSLERFRHPLETELDAFNGRIGDPRSFDALDALLGNQHYRLAYWRVGLEELNYRRFFDVTSLVALRMELPDVFDAAHALIFKWVREGKISGLRVDHPDGLWDPEQYFKRLRRRFAEANSKKSRKPPPYVVAEKILTRDERLSESWPIDGTTGYDFLNKVNGLFVDGASAAAFDALYKRFTGGAADFNAVVDSSKRVVLFSLFQKELVALAVRLKRLAENTRHGTDFTLSQLRAALAEVLIAFPVYRTYITARNARAIEAGKATRDRSSIRSVEQKWICDAIGAARAANPNLEGRVFDWLKAVLLLEPLDSPESRNDQQGIEFVMRFQQLTGPLMAKGLEDTAFYRFNRLVCLNEVGGDPGRFGVSVEAFHAYNLSKAPHWPHSMLATATHDTKRGEDHRARLNVLSEMPGEWAAAVRRWHNLNAGHRTIVAGELTPHPNDEYLLYQTLAGAWVSEAESGEGSKDFLQRISEFMLKALREAKTHTSWLDPNQAYEDAITRFITSILSKPGSIRFLADFLQFQRRLAFFGQFNSLGQTLLKLTSPGVPDIYQGTELWDFSLVDPDNRRPVDYDLRRRLLTGLAQEVSAAKGKLGPLLERLLRDNSSGEIKLFLIWRALKFRARHRELFEHGGYIPLGATGAKREHICAFARIRGSEQVLVVAPRLVLGLTNGVERPPLAEVWQDTCLKIPQQPADLCYRNVFTGQVLQSQETRLRVHDLLREFPVGFFERVPATRLRRREPSANEAKPAERWRSQRPSSVSGLRKMRRQRGLR